MNWAWRAVDAQGREFRGWQSATGRQQLAAQLAAQGLTLLALRWHWSGPSRWSRREQLHFFFELAHLLDAGMPLLDALAALRIGADTTGRMRLDQLIGAVEAGQPLSQALQGIDAVSIGLIRAGEASGCLPQILHRLVVTLRWQDELTGQLRQALAYPAFALLVMTGALLFLVLQVVPELTGFLRTLDVPLPWTTRWLLGISAALRQYGLWLLVSLPGLVAILSRYARGERLERCLLRLPLLGALLRRYWAARFAFALALLYEAGVPLLDALTLCEEVAGSRVLGRLIAAAGSAVRQGSGLAQAFSCGDFFPPLALRMLAVGERSGGLDVALRNAAAFHEREVREQLARLQSLLEPVLTLCLGGILAFLMLAILGPVFTAIGSVR